TDYVYKQKKCLDKSGKDRITYAYSFSYRKTKVLLGENFCFFLKKLLFPLGETFVFPKRNSLFS
ncbi:hypothetical protein, partial [Parabacteroides sp. AF27-14]|uniref:hypothetical protein n=1 Tax=Parabacteroides sp. AF27-14 TaxID=2293116 RepID=UPI001F2ECCCF